jgi:hypothetical protein
MKKTSFSKDQLALWYFLLTLGLGLLMLIGLLIRSYLV